ncbi:MAG: pyridoxal phosphate-dependent aminotransferase [Oscillospiraceae bacterium]
MNISTMLRESIRAKPASKRSARQKTSTPKNVTRMNLNENAYGMSEVVKKVLIDAVADNYMYQDFYAVDIREKLAENYALTPDHVLVASGSSAVIDMLGEVFINYGDEIVYCSPSYEAFPDMVSDNGGVRVEVPLTGDYKFDLDGMLAAITDKTKMVIVVNPNNPTGSYIPSAEVEAFVKKLPPHVLPVVDEAYFEYVTTPGHYSLIEMIQKEYDRPLIVLRTFSKIYGLAGLRIGYAIAHPAIVDEMMKTCQAWNVSRSATLAALAALENQEYVRTILQKNAENRTYLAQGLKALGCFVVEPAANFIYFNTYRNSKVVSQKLAEKRILISTPDSFNRVTVGKMEQNTAFLTALKEVLDELPPQN